MNRRLLSGYAAALLVIGACPCIALAQVQPSAPENADESTIIPEPTAPQRLPLDRPSTPAPTTQPALGSADPRSVSPRFGLLGNLGGVRDRLWENGILLNLGYVYEGATNAAGGDRTLARGAAQFAAKGLFDFEKMLGLEGGSGVVAFSQRHGRDLTLDAHLGTQTSVEEIYGRRRIWRLSQFWYDQKFGPWVDLKVGRMPSGDDFAGFACEFQINALCGAPIGKIAGNYVYNFPVSQWATRLRVGTPDTAYLQVGAYQVNPDNLADGFSFNFSKGTGALILSEAGWFPKFGGSGYAGSYKIGGWYETSGGNDVLLNDRRLPSALYRGQPLHHDGRNGLYFVGVQEVYRPDPANSKRTVSAFVRAVASDRDTSVYAAQVTSGLVYKGWCAERPNDWIGLGVGQTTPNPRAVEAIEQRNLISRTNRPMPAQERFVEAFYSIAVTDNVVVRPNIQYITRRATPKHKPDVVVFGLTSLITF
jgi:porin